MLKTVGLSVAMGNAPDELKAIADYVTDHIDDDGVYKALKHFAII
jgi:hydroxymethylpyrimidine pyrophosphatase-like HAD family hydrolase